MKILFLTHRFYPDIGGIEMHSEIMAEAFCRSGHSLRVVTWTKAEGDKTFPFPVMRNPSASALLQLHRWADVVFENNPSLRLSWPTYLVRRPRVVVLHTWISRANGKQNLRDAYKLFQLRYARHVVAVSEAVRRRCWVRATVIGNPFRTEVFGADAMAQRHRDFVFLGRLVSDKGADLAIRALQQSGHQAHLTIVGQGPEESALRQLTADLGITDRVTFAGALRDLALARCLNSHRFMLIPSVWEEPFGIVALEGLACGCVPIASDGGGLPDAIGKAGLLFERGNLEALATAMRRLLSDAALETSLRAAAAEHLRKFHPETIAAQYLQTMASALPS